MSRGLMLHRIKAVLATLKDLREPEYLGEVMNVPLRTETTRFSVKDSESRDICQSHLTVKAEVFRCNDRKWLEWVIDIR